LREEGLEPQLELERHLLHHREGEKLDDWLEKVRASHIRELQSFV